MTWKSSKIGLQHPKCDVDRSSRWQKFKLLGDVFFSKSLNRTQQEQTPDCVTRSSSDTRRSTAEPFPEKPTILSISPTKSSKAHKSKEPRGEAHSPGTPSARASSQAAVARLLAYSEKASWRFESIALKGTEID